MKVGAEAAKKIAAMLKKNNTVTTIDLSCKLM